MKYEFINKALYLPEIKTLAIGDMHLGHEFMLKETGSLIPTSQKEQTKADLEKVFKELKSKNKLIEKVIFLGDIKHFFAYKKAEKNILLELLLMISEHVKRENIILIKGNHEKMAEIADKEFKEFHIEKEIAFIHGDKEIPETLKPEIKTRIMAHLHPAITITDPQGIKKEKYKAFLTGKYKNKETIILPSFIPTNEGTSLNEFISDTACIIPASTLKKFTVHAIGENQIFNFGQLKSIR